MNKRIILSFMLCFICVGFTLIGEDISPKIKVNDTEIEKEMALLSDDIRNQYSTEELKAEVKAKLEEEKILMLEAEEKGYDKKKDILDEIEKLRKNLVISTLLEEEILDGIKLSDSDVEKFYNDHKENFNRGKSVKARHILITTMNMNEEEKQAAKGRAQKLLEKALAGDDFSKLAKENSEGPSAKEEGDLGWFCKGDMLKEFEDAAFKCEKNSVYPELVETVYGYHIIYVEDEKQKTYVPYEDLKDNLKKQLLGNMQYEAYTAYINELREKYGV